MAVASRKTKIYISTKVISMIQGFPAISKVYCNIA